VSATTGYAGGSAARPTSAQPLRSQPPLTERERLKETVGARLRAKVGHMDCRATMSALGVAVAGGTDADIRKAYKKAALKFHPDRNRQVSLPRSILNRCAAALRPTSTRL
jgi:hypothetical protein